MSDNKLITYGTYALTGLTALAFAAAGLAKLAGVEMVHQSFAVMGLPSITGYIVGLLEVAGAIGLFVKPVRALAALGLAATGIGAFAYHAIFTPIGEGVPALVLFVFSVVLFMAFRKQPAAA